MKHPEPDLPIAAEPSSEIPSSEVSAELGQLARIRDLLFGESARATDSRLGQLEGLLKEQSRLLRQETDDAAAALRADLAALESRQAASLEEERDSLLGKHGELHERFDATALVLGQRIEAGDRALGDSLGARLTALETKLGERLDELRDELRFAVSELRSAAVDRESLAADLGAIAMRLAGDGSAAKRNGEGAAKPANAGHPGADTSSKRRTS